MRSLITLFTIAGLTVLLGTDTARAQDTLDLDEVGFILVNSRSARNVFTNHAPHPIRITFAAEGEWSHTKLRFETHGPDGVRRPAGKLAPDRRLPLGALIGRKGDEHRWQLIGRRRTIGLQAGQSINFVLNDNFRHDNKGVLKLHYAWSAIADVCLPSR